MGIVKPFRGRTPDKTHPLHRGLVGLWLMNEGSGTQVWDYSGNRNHGEINDATWKPGKFGNKLKFNGSSDYVITNAVNFTDHVALSCVAWVYHLDVTIFNPYNQHIIGVGGGNWGPYTHFIVYAHTDQKLRLEYSGIDGYDNVTTASNTLLVDTWNCVACTIKYTGGTTYTDLFLNGVLVASNSNVGDYVINNSRPILIGASTWSSYPANPPERFLNGHIDHARFYNRALTAAEIKQLYLNPFPGWS